MNPGDYDYTLPAELIAQEPTETRDRSRLLVLDKTADTLYHHTFSDITDYLSTNDLLVVNNTRVFPARLIGKKIPSGGEIELFLLRSDDDIHWEALTRPSRRIRKGAVIDFGDELLKAVIEEKGAHGKVFARLESHIPLWEAIDTIGQTPLPPYIKRSVKTEDRERYQTVYARHRGSVAAPTAGLHFSEHLLDTFRAQGVKMADVTLHVGIGTFRPLSDEEAAGNTLHSEYCIVTGDTADLVRRCRASGGRVFAVGTTTTRALETASRDGDISAFEGWTDLFIKPPYRFRSVDCLVTNFHLPRSSLLMMVCALAGREKILRAYREAVKERYRFYSYGDAMLIL